MYKNHTAAFAVYCLLRQYQYDFNALFSPCLSLRTGAIQILSSTVAIEERERERD